MSAAERANSCISVEFDRADSGAILLGHRVERFWNGGRYDEALAQLGNLESRVGPVAVGNSWRNPLPTFETELWGRDVRIGNRDSLMQVAFDREDSSGNLFVALRRREIPHLTVCMSTDGGTTWGETYMWNGSPPTAIAAAVLGNHFFVVYNSPGDDPRHIRLRRFRCGDGLADTFPGGAGAWVVPCTMAVGDTMKEVSLVANPNSNRLYIVTLVSDGSVLTSSAGPSAVSWTTRPTGTISGARGGLDAAADQRSDMDHIFLSFYDTSDTMRVYDGDGQRTAQPAGTGTLTSISAYLDAVVCVYEDASDSPPGVRCAASFNGGDTWMVSTLNDSGSPAAAPAVVVPGGSEFAAAYRQDSPTPGLFFCQRTDSGPWSDPVSIAEHQPDRRRPGIRRVDNSGIYGVVYLSDSSPVVRGAWFDRSDWAYGIAERRQPPGASLKPQATVVGAVLFLPRDGLGTRSGSPGNPVMSRVILLDVSGRGVLRLHPGVNDVSMLSPGVYFVREAQARAVRKVVVTR